jgi:hypothetical protein
VVVEDDGEVANEGGKVEDGEGGDGKGEGEGPVVMIEGNWRRGVLPCIGNLRKIAMRTFLLSGFPPFRIFTTP